MVIQYAAGERKCLRYIAVVKKQRPQRASYWEVHSNTDARWTSVSVTGFFK